MPSLAVPVFLTVNALVNPIGVHEAAPHLSWQLAPLESQRGIVQVAYEIKVSSQPGGPADLWDSGKVEGDACTQIPYAGKSLPSRARAYWQVTTWDQHGSLAASPSVGAYWEMGLLDRSDWVSAWIGAPWHGSKQSASVAPYLRRTFSLDQRPVSARLYVTALGLYEAYINGTRVGQDVLTPGWTDYRKRVQYQVYDVAGMLRPGDNVIGTILVTDGTADTWDGVRGRSTAIGPS